MAFLKIPIALCTALASLSAFAAPTATPPKSCTPQPLATFDDIASSAVTNPIGVYRTLNWPGISVGQYLSTSPTGVVPQSGKQFAVFSTETQTVGLAKAPAITVQNDGSTTKTFALGPFYYGCAVSSQESLLGLPAVCTVTATGYDAMGKQIAKQSFPYKFVSAKQGMSLASPSSAFTNLYSVSFTLGGLVTNTAVSGLLDSMSLTTCTS